MFENDHSGALGRDVLMAEVQQLAGALARLLFDVQAAGPEEAGEVLETGIARALGMPLAALRSLPREQLLSRAGRNGGGLDASTRLALAGVLALDDASEGRRRAVWLYESALSEGAAVPVDLFERLHALRSSLPEPLRAPGREGEQRPADDEANPAEGGDDAQHRRV